MMEQLKHNQSETHTSGFTTKRTNPLLLQASESKSSEDVISVADSFLNDYDPYQFAEFLPQKDVQAKPVFKNKKEIKSKAIIKQII